MAQKIYFADRRLLKDEDRTQTVLEQARLNLQRELDVPLHFSLQYPPEFPQTAEQQDVLAQWDLATVGVSANFGQNAGKELKAGDWKSTRRRLGKGWPALPLVRPAPDNELGCQEHLALPEGSDGLAAGQCDPQWPYDDTSCPYKDKILLIRVRSWALFEASLWLTRSFAW